MFIYLSWFKSGCIYLSWFKTYCIYLSWFEARCMQLYWFKPDSIDLIWSKLGYILVLIPPRCIYLFWVMPVYASFYLFVLFSVSLCLFALIYIYFLDLRRVIFISPDLSQVEIICLACVHQSWCKTDFTYLYSLTLQWTLEDTFMQWMSEVAFN